jgi:prolyl-tRNA synthetase
VVYVSKEKGIAINKEVLEDEVLKDLEVEREELVEAKAIEVGNIFSLGTKFSDALDLKYVDEKGERQPVIMGSYGIGPGRLMGTIAESLGDDKGLVWPTAIAPFAVHLIEINPKTDNAVSEKAKYLYETLSKNNVEVLFDDRETTAGAKFKDADLIGIPMQIIVSERNLAENVVEVKYRKDDSILKVTEDKLFSLFQINIS